VIDGDVDSETDGMKDSMVRWLEASGARTPCALDLRYMEKNRFIDLFCCKERRGRVVYMYRR